MRMARRGSNEATTECTQSPECNLANLSKAAGGQARRKGANGARRSPGKNNNPHPPPCYSDKLGAYLWV